MGMRFCMPLRMIVFRKFESPVFPEDHAKTRATSARPISTTNVVLFEQRLVARLVLALDVIEQGTARGDHLQETPA